MLKKEGEGFGPWKNQKPLRKKNPTRKELMLLYPAK